GLDVQLIYFTGGTTGGFGLVSGEVSICRGAGPTFFNRAFGGAGFLIVGGGGASLGYLRLSWPEIKNAEQLKGGSVAISNFGAAADFVARYALDKLGLVPGKDVTIVQVGGISDRLGAVLVGRVQATVLSPPVNFIGQRKGLNIL